MKQVQNYPDTNIVIVCITDEDFDEKVLKDLKTFLSQTSEGGLMIIRH